MADIDDDIPLTDEERALAERGRRLVAAAMAHPEARAPQALRDALADRFAPAPPPPPAPAPAPDRPRRRLRARVLAPVLALAALVAVPVAVALLGGSAEVIASPTVQQVAAIARQPATAPPPAAIGGTPPLLAARVGRLSFPDWEAAYAWRATGRRDDRAGDRAITTVFYRYHDKATVGYAIVAGPSLGWGRGEDVTRRGHRYRVYASAGRRTVTWTQSGHTCVIDAPATVSAAELISLAAWA
jgi:hypothetical protein